MENYFQDLVWERPNIDRLHASVTDLLLIMVLEWADAGADAVMFCEDWGLQNRLLVSPRMWRDVFKPIYACLCGTARSDGLHVIMHSCGCVWDILDDLAEVGVSAMQFDQPALYGLDRLAAKLREVGMCLYAPVDIQQVMPTGDRMRIEAEARRMVDLFSHGFIATNYGDLRGIGVEPEWDNWAYEVFRQTAEGA
jgi:uroporphyrinogen-III decarboxylase